MSLLAMTLLVLAGSAYRFTASHFHSMSHVTIDLDVPLKDFPDHIGNWTGKDVPLSETIIKVAGNDDYIIRNYKNAVTGQYVSLYIAFSARPSTMRGHKPANCYPANGWLHDSTSNTDIPLVSGNSLSCLIHRFHKPLPESGNVVVLNYYILDGRSVTNEESFSGLKYRMVKYSRNPQRYVTQVQISSRMANSVIDAASEFGDVISEFFPETDSQ